MSRSTKAARGPFADKVSALIAESYGLPDMGAADRQDAREMVSYEVVGVSDAPSVPAFAPTARRPAIPSLSLVECVAIWSAEARVRKYLAVEMAAYFGVAFEEVHPILDALPPSDRWAFETPGGWGELVNYVSERLFGSRPDELIGPTIH